MTNLKMANHWKQKSEQQKSDSFFRWMLVLFIVLLTVFAGLLKAQAAEELSPAIIQAELRALENDKARIQQEFRANNLDINNRVQTHMMNNVEIRTLQDRQRELQTEAAEVEKQILEFQKQLLPEAAD